MQVHLYVAFVNKYTVDPPYLRVLHPQIQATTGRKQYFPFEDGNPWMQKANCMPSSLSFYVRDLSIRGFWYLQGSWHQSPVGTEGGLQVKFWRSQSYIQIFDCVGVGTPTPCIVRGSIVYIWYYIFFSLEKEWSRDLYYWRLKHKVMVIKRQWYRCKIYKQSNKMVCLKNFQHIYNNCTTSHCEKVQIVWCRRSWNWILKNIFMELLASGHTPKCHPCGLEFRVCVCVCVYVYINPKLKIS